MVKISGKSDMVLISALAWAPERGGAGGGIAPPTQKSGGGKSMFCPPHKSLPPPTGKSGGGKILKNTVTLKRS